MLTLHPCVLSCHVVPLPLFRSHSSAIECLQQQEALSFLQQAILVYNPHNLVHAGVHERCHDIVERFAAQTILPSRVAARLTIILQRLQGWRSCVHIVPDVSCDFSCHEPALDTTVLHVNEPATNHLGARTQCCSRDHEQHILRTQRAKLSFGPLAPFVFPAVRWSSGCTQTSEASARPHSELCKVSKHFQTVQLLSPLPWSCWSFPWPMVAWLSTCERSTSVLCCRLAWTSRRMSVNVTS